MLNYRKRPLGQRLSLVAMFLLLGGHYTFLKSPAHEIFLWTGIVALVGGLALLIAARINRGGPATPSPLSAQRP
jgi:protein-S-isoprenylcysteine O-methyltransferase Ste14